MWLRWTVIVDIPINKEKQQKCIREPDTEPSAQCTTHEIIFMMSVCVRGFVVQNK